MAIGITSLALIALIRAEPDLAVHYYTNIERAAEFLLRQPRRDGAFVWKGKVAGLQQCLATCALLELWLKQPDPRLKERLQDALNWMCRHVPAAGPAPYLELSSPAHVRADEWKQRAMLLAAGGGFSLPGQNPAGRGSPDVPGH